METGIKSLNEYIKNQFQVDGKDIKTYSPLTLAYIGDAVYELFIRTVIVNQANAPVNKLHKKSSMLVKAQAQATVIHRLEEELSEEEHDIYKRGRNAKPHTSAKNASMTDYRAATGFEALIGYLYMTDQTQRMADLIKRGLEILAE